MWSWSWFVIQCNDFFFFYCFHTLGKSKTSDRNYSRSSVMTNKVSNLTKQSFHEISRNDRSVNETGFNLMTHDSYFTILVKVFTNHILAENSCFTIWIEWTEHKIIVLKPANKYQIIWNCHNFKIIFMDNFHHHQFLYWAKVL